MTVAIGNEIGIGPAAGAGSSGSGGGLLPGAAPLSGGHALSRQSGAGGKAENFRARWQSELAAMRSEDQGDGEDEQAARGRESKSGALPGFAGVNVPSSQRSAGAKDPMTVSASASEVRNTGGNSVIRNSENDGRDNTQEAGATGSAESRGSKETQNNKEAKKRDDVHSRTKADSQKDAASLQSMTVAPMEMAPFAVAQQIQGPALAASAGTSTPAGYLGVSAARKAAGDMKSTLPVESGSAANAHPLRAVQTPRGLVEGRAASAANGGQMEAVGSDSVAEDSAHGAASGSRESGTRDGFIGDAAGDGGRGVALPTATTQGTHEVVNTPQANPNSAIAAQGDTGQGNAIATSDGAAPADVTDASREGVSASRPGRSSNVGPNASQNPGHGAGEGSAIQGHEGGIAVTPAVGVVGTPHGMPSQPAGAAAGTPGSGSGNGSEKSAGETFAAMDAQANGSGLTWVHAGPHQAEAGFQDPALGWVSVRAEMGAGGVHAAIVPGTADAAQALGGHMAGLSAHLAEQHVGVSSVSMNNPGNSPANSPNSLGLTSQLAGGGAGHSGGYSNTGQGQQQPADTRGSYAMSAVASPSGARATAHFDSGVRPVAAASAMTGRHISVVA